MTISESLMPVQCSADKAKRRSAGISIICKSISLEESASIQRSAFYCLPRGFCAVLVANHAVGRCLSRIVGHMCNMRASNAGGLTRWEKGSALRLEQIERCSIAAASHSMRQRIVVLRRPSHRPARLAPIHCLSLILYIFSFHH